MTSNLPDTPLHRIRDDSLPPFPKITSFSGLQLSLFQTFLCNTDDERDKLSNTIEFWDMIPKYFMSRKDMDNIRSSEGFLPKLERSFLYAGRSFTVRIRPARITDTDGNEREFYPSAREELVEDALRKLASDVKCGFYEETSGNVRCGVAFSLYMLRKELARRGHTSSYYHVVEALFILADAGIEIYSADGKSVLKTSILPALAGVCMTKLQSDPQARWYVDFCPMVTQSLRSLTYRQFNYHIMMRHNSQMARWIHKRLAHNYTNASPFSPYDCLFSSLKRDSGLLDYKRERDSIRKLEEAFQILCENEILSSYNKEMRQGPRNRILDIKYTLIPHATFIKEIKAANKRASDNRGKSSTFVATSGERSS